MARAAGENPPAMGYIDCPGLHRQRLADSSCTSHSCCVSVLTVCVVYSQPSEVVWDLSHPPRRDGVTGGVWRPGQTCSTNAT